MLVMSSLLRIQKIFIGLAFIFSFFTGAHFAFGQEHPWRERKLIVFESPTCKRCIKAKEELIPLLKKDFKQIEIQELDYNNIDNYKLLLSLKEKYAPEMKIALPIFYFEGSLLNGEDANQEALREFVSNLLSAEHPQHSLPKIDLIAYFKSFQPLAVIGAGLIDGINPCAFTVIVFFISFLAVQGYRRRQLFAIGVSFIFAVFLTYLLIGLGLFGFLYKISGFWLITKIFNLSVGGLSIIFGFLALYDFFKYRKTGKTEGLALQLPTAVKNRIHSVIGLHYRSKDKGSAPETRSILKLLISALVTGFLVSLLEAVCTGQVYLPTIAFVLKTTRLKLEALGYLLLYNTMFILPLFVIFILGLFGTTSGEFSAFLKKHLSALKLLMAVLFFGLGILLLWKF